MILLDTNVISALMRDQPDPSVVAWLDRQPRVSIWTTSINIFELRFGLRIMPFGKRQALMASDLQRLKESILSNRVASFDYAAAEETATLMASRKKAGRPVDLRDSMIAGITLSLHATLATRNLRHFEDLTCPVVDPWS
jgi:predicted nucleic acid-binding protein